MTTTPAEITTVRCHDRFTNCASCKARATWLVRCAGWTTFASACDRHLPTWQRRAERAAAESRGES